MTETGAAAIVAALTCGSGSCSCAATARRGSGLVHCPAHDDPGPSLNVGGLNGKVLVKCHAGCPQDAVVAALRERGLWNGTAPRSEPRRIVATYDYVDEHGALLYQEVRYAPKAFAVRRPDGQGGWIWNLEGVRRVPYNLPQVLAAAKAGGRVYVVEGAKDADALIALGLVATTNALGAGKWIDPYAESLRGAEVIVIADKDAPGRAHAQTVARSGSGTANGMKLLELSGDEVKDASDWLSAGGTKAELERMANEAPEWRSDEKRGATTTHSTRLSAGESVPFAATDLGNAERLVARHGRDIRYIATLREWYAWDGRRFRVDDTGELERRAKDTTRRIYDEAAAADDPAQRRSLAAHAMKSEAAPKLGAMLALAQSDAHVALRADALDVDPWLFNVANGTIDLRTGELGPHRREDLMTKVAMVEYDAGAECPTWLAFLRRAMAGDDALVAFLRRAVGYTLTGDTSEQKLFLFHGGGANGKSTFQETHRALHGEYARQSDFSTFLAQRGDSVRNDIARLRGARLVTATEMEDRRALAEVVVKQLTGGDTVTARRLYAEFFEFRPTFKLVLAANHKPIIRGSDHAIWRRICLVPFRVTIPADEQDPHLAQKLRDELPGILAWAVQGCLEWQAQGLNPPAIVLAATEDYREEMDTLGDFLEERCVVEAGASVSAKDLYAVYGSWSQANGEHPMSQKAFGMRLAERGFERGKSSDRGRARVWRDLRLSESQSLDMPT